MLSTQQLICNVPGWALVTCSHTYGLILSWFVITGDAEWARNEQRLWICMFLVPWGSHKSGDRNEQSRCLTQAAVCSSGTAQGRAKGSFGDNTLESVSNPAANPPTCKCMMLARLIVGNSTVMIPHLWHAQCYERFAHFTWHSPCGASRFSVIFQPEIFFMSVPQ